MPDFVDFAKLSLYKSHMYKNLLDVCIDALFLWKPADIGINRRAGTSESCWGALAHASNGNPKMVRFLKSVFAGGFPGVRLSVGPTDHMGLSTR